MHRCSNPLLVALVCFGLTLALATLSLQAEFAKSRLHFEQTHDSFANALVMKMTTCAELVRYIAGIFSANPLLSPLTFREYLADSNDLPYPHGLRMIGFAQKVPTADAHKLELQFQKLGLRDFRIYPNSKEEFEFPVVAIDPYNAKTRSLIGFDIKSTFMHAANQQQVGLSTKATITSKKQMDFAQSHEPGFGIAIFHPVFKKGSYSESTEDRESLLFGYAFGTIWPSDFIKSIITDEGKDLASMAIEVYDSPKIDRSQLLFETPGSLSRSVFLEDFNLVRESRVEMLDRTWTIVTRMPFTLPALKRFQFAFGVVTLGSILSIAIFLVLQGREKKAALISLLLDEAKRELATRKKIQDELSVSYERFRLVSQAAMDVIWDLDLTTKKVTWNDALELSFGHKINQDSTSLTWFFDKIHPADREQIIAQRQEIIASDRDNWKLTYRLIATDLTYHRVFERSFIVRNAQHQAIRILGIIQDLNPIDKAQDALRRSEERLHLAIEAGDLGIWELLNGFHSFNCSIRLQQMLGITTESITVVRLLQLIPRCERKEVVTNLRQKIERGIQRFTLQIPVKHKNSKLQLRWIEIHGKAFKLPSDKGTLQYAGVALDVTAQKNVALEILEAKVAAESANASKSLFLANISHEIRTPLAAIQGFSKLLNDPEISAEDHEYFCGMVEKNGSQLMALIDDLLDFTKIETNNMLLEKVPFSLRQLMADVVNSLSIKASEKGLQIHIEYEPDVPDNLTSDPTRLRQVLYNIIGNGIKFTDRGYVSVKVQRLLTKGQQNYDIRFIITDSGIGMTHQQQQGLFQAFTQADASTTRRYGGTGLGLVISKGLAQAMSGDLRLLASVPKQGSSFELIIESGVNAASYRADMPDSVRPPRTNLMQQIKEYEGLLSNKSILVADDALENRILLQRILSKTGAEILCAENGSDAFDRFNSHRFDAVILDIQMPVCDGYQAAALLRKQGYRGPLIALTAHAMREERARCLEAGFDEHITKPVDFLRLIETLRRMMLVTPEI